jgi:hypothetical protein
MMFSKLPPSLGRSLRGLTCLTGAFKFCFLLICSYIFIKEAFARDIGLVEGLFEFLSSFIFTKKLFAHKKHSEAKPIALDVLFMPLTRTDLFTILNRIAAERHSGAIAVAILDLISCQPVLDFQHYIRFREEAKGPSFYVAL